MKKVIMCPLATNILSKSFVSLFLWMKVIFKNLMEFTIYMSVDFMTGVESLFQVNGMDGYSMA